MNTVLNDLYRGEINPNESTRIRDPEYLNHARESVRLAEELNTTLNPEQKRIFENYVNACSFMDAIETQSRFADGFRLGAKLILEVFYR